jgi:hypothetical protein
MDERTALAATALEAFETAEPRRRAGPTPTAPGPTGSRSTPRRRRRRSMPSSRSRPGTRCSASAARAGAGRLAAPSLREARWTIAAVALAFVVGLLPTARPARAASTCSRRRCGACSPGTSSSTSACWSGRWSRSRAAHRDDARGPIVRGVAERIRGRPPVAAARRGRQRARACTVSPRSGSSAAAAIATRRAELLLHAAAAALALGLIAGLYLRGLVFDYRVGWESTFLTPDAAVRSSRPVLAPASQLSASPCPTSRPSRRCARSRVRRRKAPRPRRGSTCWH